MAGWDTYGTPLNRSPAFQREWQYGEATYFSSNGITNVGIFSGVGASAMILPPVEGYAYIVWGWDGMYFSTSTTLKKKDLLIKVTDEDADHVLTLIRASSLDNTSTMLSQPLKAHANTGLFITTMELKDFAPANDSAVIQIYYGIVNGYDGNSH
jgi:hypothetical protein